MRKIKKVIALLLPIAVPLTSFAASGTIITLLGKIAQYIINPIIILGFVIATIFLFWGIIQMIWGADKGDLEKNKKNVMYGVIGLFIMFSVYGILNLIVDSFGIDCGLYFCKK